MPSARPLGLPVPYPRFDGQYIAGSWRPGKHGGKEVDTDPYSGETLAETATANARDLDEAYRSAAEAQIHWANRLPAERAAVMLRSVTIMDARHAEIVDWIIRESGSTRYKAGLEWGAVRPLPLKPHLSPTNGGTHSAAERTG